MKSGYFLIEVTVYITCSILLLSFFLTGLNRFNNLKLYCLSGSNKLLQNYIGFNSVVSKLRLVDFSMISQTSKSSLKYKEQDSIIEWYFSKNRLLLSKNGSHSLILSNISSCEFTLNKNYIYLKIVFIGDKSETLSSYIYARNSILAI